MKKIQPQTRFCIHILITLPSLPNHDKILPHFVYATKLVSWLLRRNPW